jgi:hypothetical protein
LPFVLPFVSTLVVVALTPSADAAAPAPAPLESCDGAQAGQALGLAPHQWQAACIAIDRSRHLIAAVPLAPQPGTLVVHVALTQDAGITWRDQVHLGADAPAELREVLAKIRRGPPPRLIWSGLGNTRESRYDYCQIDGMASFTLADDHTLERQVRVTPVINRETRLPRARARAIEKGCVAKPAPAERFPVTP